MAKTAPRIGSIGTLDLPGLQALIDTLARLGYRVLGPVVRDGAIVFDEIASTADLPAGYADHQAPGSYRLSRRRSGALFGYAVGPHSAKPFLHLPLLTLFSAQRLNGGLQIDPRPIEAPRQAFIGIRPCDLAAIAIQDRVLRGGAHASASYRAHRDRAFLVAVNCGEPGGTCFCASMGTGPKASAPFDLALTEVLERQSHVFLLEIGSEAGAHVAAGLPVGEASQQQMAAADATLRRAAGRMGRALTTEGLAETLQRNYDHPRWNEVASRCLTCCNCTNVCPTCFCTTVEDTTDLSGEHASRRQRWDSCFTVQFSYIFGGSVRSSVAARYRQWLLHKLATWHNQFGTSGCVGCGRCITWCPAGIDITEEAAAICVRSSNGKDPTGGNP